MSTESSKNSHGIKANNKRNRVSIIASLQVAAKNYRRSKDRIRTSPFDPRICTPRGIPIYDRGTTVVGADAEKEGGGGLEAEQRQEEQNDEAERWQGNIFSPPPRRAKTESGGQVGGGRWRGHDGAAYRKGESRPPRAGPDSDAGRSDEGCPAERRAVVELFRLLVLVGLAVTALLLTAAE